jgi:hypothetical protein
MSSLRLTRGERAERVRFACLGGFAANLANLGAV